MQLLLVAASRFSSLSGAFACDSKKAYRPDGLASGPFFGAPTPGQAKKNRAEARFYLSNLEGLLVGACTNDFDFHATVFRAAFGGLVVSNWLLLAFAFGVNTVFLNAFGHQVCLDSF